jgi:hypothetical protein
MLSKFLCRKVISDVHAPSREVSNSELMGLSVLVMLSFAEGTF